MSRRPRVASLTKDAGVDNPFPPAARAHLFAPWSSIIRICYLVAPLLLCLCLLGLVILNRIDPRCHRRLGLGHLLFSTLVDCYVIYCDALPLVHLGLCLPFSGARASTTIANPNGFDLPDFAKVDPPVEEEEEDKVEAPGGALDKRFRRGLLPPPRWRRYSHRP